MSDTLELLTSKTEKKRNTLAVFEQIKCKEKKPVKVPPYRCSILNSSTPQYSDNELSQEEDSRPKKKRSQGVRLLEEILSLTCLWEDCGQTFTDYHHFIKHITGHVMYIDVISQSTEHAFKCGWRSCMIQLFTTFQFKQHLVYHGYLARLINIGNNVLKRTSLPDCLLENELEIPIESGGYKCEWNYCGIYYSTIYDFYEHIRAHVHGNPKACKRNESIFCGWKGCLLKFSSQYKLADHVRSHSKEKTIACPTCLTLFTTKTKFSDHRKRQLALELQSYQCSQCSKLFPSERLLRDHMRSHINLYKCTMCDMTCARPSTLKTHMRYRHLSDKPYNCNLCEHRFVSKQSLEAHLLTHFPEKLIACDDCEFHCRSMIGLDKHYQDAHGQGWSRRYECHCCQKQFPQGNRLTKHLMKEHNFHWPSGHSRFRYKEDPDCVFRLQTVRYESIEVTQEIIRTNNSEAIMGTLKDNHSYSNDTPSKYMIVFAENGQKNVVCSTDNTIVISINDIDEEGNVLNSQVVQSNEMKVLTNTDPTS